MSRYSPFQFGELLLAALIIGAVSIGLYSKSSSDLNVNAGGAYDVPLESSWLSDIEYYRFSAANLSAAHTNMFDASPIVIEGKKFSGLMQWKWEWRGKYDTSNGGCAPDRIVTQASSTIRLPKWDNVDDASYSDRKEWERAQKVLLRHEKKHEAIAKLAVKEFERKANALPAEESCEAMTETINGLFDRYMDQANKQNKHYDKRTEHGRTEGTVLRLPNFAGG